MISGSTFRIALIISLVILIIAIIATPHHARIVANRSRKRKYEKIKKLDDPEFRQSYMRDAEEQVEDLDADDLFTKATLYLRIQDGLQDEYMSRSTSRKRRKQIAQQLQHVSHTSRNTIRAAIEKRNNENNEHKAGNKVARNAQLFDDDTLDRRAVEIEEHPDIQGDHIVDLPRNGDAKRADEIPHVERANPSKAKWAPDPENVHDSAVGDDVSHRLKFLQNHDLHLFDESTCIGAIAFIISNRIGKSDPDDIKKREKILRTIKRAQSNDYCYRYNINELEAMRLVLERAHHMKNEESKNNLHDAFLNSLADCAEAPTGTVCTVGRISRYVASLDVIDKDLPESAIKSVDAYRSEIFNRLGKMQAHAVSAGADTDDIHKRMDGLLAEYKDKIPGHSMEKIKAECEAAF